MRSNMYEHYVILVNIKGQEYIFLNDKKNW